MLLMLQSATEQIRAPQRCVEYAEKSLCFGCLRHSQVQKGLKRHRSARSNLAEGGFASGNLGHPKKAALIHSRFTMCYKQPGLV